MPISTVADAYIQYARGLTISCACAFVMENLFQASAFQEYLRHQRKEQEKEKEKKVLKKKATRKDLETEKQVTSAMPGSICMVTHDACGFTGNKTEFGCAI